jgi:hypothetical protein
MATKLEKKIDGVPAQERGGSSPQEGTGGAMTTEQAKQLSESAIAKCVLD